MSDSSSENIGVTDDAVKGSSVEKLYHWIADNPVEDLSPGKSQKALKKLLWAIYAPHDLMQFLSVTDQLPGVLVMLEEFERQSGTSRLKDFGISTSELVAVAEHLHHSEACLVDLLGGGINAKKSDKHHPLRKYLGKYYVYAALMASSESGDDDVNEKLTQLKAAVLLCHMLLIKKYFSPDDYFSKPSDGKYQNTSREKESTINACRFIRQASHDDSNEHLDALSSFSSISKLLRQIKSQKDDETEAFKKINPILSKAFRERNPAGGGNGSWKGRAKWSVNVWDDGFVKGREGQFVEKYIEEGRDIFVVSAPPADEADEAEEAGLSPDEGGCEEELLLVDDDNPKSVRIFAKYQVKHLEMANQQFKFSWDKNSSAELSEVLQLFGKIIRGPADRLIHETVCVGVIMLVTGEALDNVVSRFRYVNSGKRVSRSTICYRWDEINGMGHWLIHPNLPKQQILLDKDARQYCEDHVQSDGIELPDALNIGSFIRRVFGSEKLQEIAGKRLFKHKQKTYRKNLRIILNGLPEGNRINEHRLRSHLFNVIASEISGDVAEATLMTGRYHPLAKTRLHYSCYPINYLQNLYTKALRRMVEGVYSEGYQVDPPKLLKTNQTNTDVIGSDYSPKISAIKNAVIELQDRLKIRPSDHSQKDIVSYHNNFTLYTVLMTGYCTGYRAVKDPFPAVPDIDRNSGLCVISDKDGADYYNSRLVWLPEVLIGQLTSYQEHREVIFNYLLMNNRNLDLLEDLPDLFLIDDYLNIQPVRPRTLRPLLVNILPLPINTNRRFLRSQLRIRGCPAEVVDAFMGHWSRGEEPWGKYSSLSYSKIVDVLKPYMDSLMKELGFRKIRSRMYGF